ncbi:MAG: hypothetical protein LBQ80_05730 [Clostridium sp.]|jgi:hypothetical protein|nr:hypothetical protein [Clostridium sp.]
MAQIYYDRNAARKIEPRGTAAPNRRPLQPQPQRRPTPVPRAVPSATPENIRITSQRRVAAVLIAIALVLAWAVPSIIADASAEQRASAFAKLESDYATALQENVRLKNEVALAIPEDEAYDTAIAEYGMVRATEDPVILD